MNLTRIGLVSLLSGLFLSQACVREPQRITYFQQHIQPILQTSCARGPTGGGCHVSDAKGNAFGNLDVTSYANVAKRHDLLVTYGPYGQPTFLLKNTPPEKIDVTLYDGSHVTVTSDIRHAGGPIFDPAGTAYTELRRWIDNGATENGAPSTQSIDGSGACDTDVPSASGFDPSVDPPDLSAFSDANDALVKRCASTQCHGATGNELHLTCGDSAERKRWNRFAVQPYIGQTTESSEILRRPLAPAQGGSFHEGGVIFQTANDDGYRAIAKYLDTHGPGDPPPSSAGFDFFAHRVQPVLARKGCMLLHCHSGASFHDYRLRGGSAGSFSLAATKRNYTLTLAQVALESDDPAAGRIFRKNMYRPVAFPTAGGIAHRGGSLFEDFRNNPASASLCQSFDYDNGDLDKIPAFCVLGEWVKRERQSRALAPLSAIVYVKRAIPKGGDRMQDFDVYEPGADLRIVGATISNAGVVLGTDTSVTNGCGLDPKTADIRRPSVSWDGKKIAFAARTSDQTPLAIYEMNADGTGCAMHPLSNHPPTQNGLLVHDFDPAYSPPDGDRGVHLFFASTRGGASGPHRTAADLSKANSNIHSYTSKGIEQLTFLLDMERAPAFMQDGRAIFTTEKRAPNFYQLALRRMNVDGGDYHPLYGQRQSIGFDQVSQVVHLADKNFAAVFSQHDAKHHGGTLGIFNRSIGVDFTSTNPNDYVMDPKVIDPSAPTSPEPEFFLHSLTFPDRNGTYASPASMPNGTVLASWGTGDPASFSGDYDLVVVDPVRGTRTKLLGDPGVAEIEAAPVYERATRTVYRSNPGEPNAYRIDPGVAWADITFHDARLVLSLMFQNTPTGRPIENDLPWFELYESLPPPLDTSSIDPSFVAKDAWGSVFVQRRLIGRVPIESDGSAHVRVPGGIPMVIALPDSPTRPRFQREAIMFTPGEHVHEAMRADQYDGFCAHCHGSSSGRPLDVAMRPDVLTAASKTIARTRAPIELLSSSGPILGP